MCVRLILNKDVDGLQCVDVLFISACARPYVVIQRSEPGGDFICTVYLEEKSDMAAQAVKVSGGWKRLVPGAQFIS